MRSAQTDLTNIARKRMPRYHDKSTNLPGGRDRIPVGTTGSFAFASKRWSLLAVILLTILFLPGVSGRTARAQDDPPLSLGVYRSEALEMAVKAGFGRLEISGWNGSWAPFRITLTNNGDALTGRLVVRAQSSQGPNPTFREFVKHVQLPTGSRQLHEIAAFLNSGADAEVTLVSNDNVVARAVVPISRSSFGGEQLEIAVVDTEATTLNNIASTEIVRPPNREPFNRRLRTETPADPEQSPPPVSPGRRGRRGMPWFQQQSPAAHPVAMSPEDLPRDFVSYDPLDAVVIGDAPMGQLIEEQVRALKLWVASGGLLIVTGAADISGLRASGLDDVLPVDAHGSITVPSLAELTSAYTLFESPDPLLVTSASLRPGARSLLGGNNLTIVAEKYYGSGLVRFVGINPKINPYRGWGAAKDLWIDLLLPAADSKSRTRNWITMGQFGPRGPVRTNRWGVQNLLFGLAGIEPTSTNYFLIFLLLYVLVVGPINYVVLRSMRKTDLAWITIPTIVILFTVVSVTVAQVTRGADPVAADVSLVEVHQRDGVERVTGGLLIMPTSKGTHEISFDGGGTYVSDLSGAPGSSSAVANIESQRIGSQFTMSVPMNTWTAGLFQIRSVSNESRPLLLLNGADVVAAPATSDPQSNTMVSVRNLSESPLSHAVYVSADGISEAFTLDAGEEKRIAVSPPSAQPGGLVDLYRTRLAADSQELTVFSDLEDVLDSEVGGERALAKDFFREPMATVLPTIERPFVMGFLETAPTKINFGNSLRRRSKALYVVHF
jgi:hypothetical protein